MSTVIGDTLYVWQTLERGEWGQIVAYLPFAGVTGPLTARKREMAERMRDIAVDHGRGAGLEVRLARFTLTEVIESLG